MHNGLGHLFDGSARPAGRRRRPARRAHRGPPSRPGARAPCGSVVTLVGARSHPPGRGWAATPSTGSAGCWPRSTPTTDAAPGDRRVRVPRGAAGRARRGRRGRQRGARSRRRHAQPSVRPRPHGRRGRGRTSARCWPRTSRTATRWRWSTWPRPAAPSLDHPVLAALVERQRPAGPGQARLDRRGPVRRAGHPGGQLRPRRRRRSAHTAEERVDREFVTARPGVVRPAAATWCASAPRARRRSGAGHRRPQVAAVPGRHRPRMTADRLQTGQPAPDFSLHRSGGPRRVARGLRRQPAVDWCSTPSPSPGCAKASSRLLATTTASSPRPVCRWWPCRATPAIAAVGRRAGLQLPVRVGLLAQRVRRPGRTAVFKQRLTARFRGVVLHRRGDERVVDDLDTDAEHRPAMRGSLPAWASGAVPMGESALFESRRPGDAREARTALGRGAVPSSETAGRRCSTSELAQHRDDLAVDGDLVGVERHRRQARVGRQQHDVVALAAGRS